MLEKNKENKSNNNFKKLRKDILSKISRGKEYKNKKRKSFFDFNLVKESAYLFSFGLGTMLYPIINDISYTPLGAVFSQTLFLSSGAFLLYYFMKIKESNDFTKKELENNVFDKIINVVDNIALDNGIYTLNKTNNSEIIKLCNELFCFNLSKNEMDKIFIDVSKELTKEDLKIVLNNDMLLNLQSQNYNLGSAVYMYCFILLAEEFKKLKDKNYKDEKLELSIKKMLDGREISKEEMMFLTHNFSVSHSRINGESIDEVQEKLQIGIESLIKIKNKENKESLFVENYILKLLENKAEVLKEKQIKPNEVKEKDILYAF